MGKILVLTSKAFLDVIKEQCASCVKVVDIKAVEVEVSSFIGLDAIADTLEKLDLEEYDAVIVPGVVAGDLVPLRERFGLPVVKGPLRAEDLKFVLKKINEVELSSVEPADLVLKDYLERNMREELSTAKAKKTGLKIGQGKKAVYLNGVPKIVAEVPDALQLSKKDLCDKISYLEAQGADIIDLGMCANQDNNSLVKELVGTAQANSKLPISFDSLNEKELRAAIDAGVDLILSLTCETVELAENLSIPAVIIPQKKGKISGGWRERVKLLAKMKKQLDEMNYDKYILDPLLYPLAMDFSPSLTAYLTLREKFSKTPLLAGAGNVTELVDADSPGVNSVIAAIATEIEIDLLYTTEASPKTKGCVAELRKAVDLMHLAKIRKCPPKDLGIDLLTLKDKRRSVVGADVAEKKISFSQVKASQPEIEQDYFIIRVDAGKIKLVHYRDNKPANGFMGTNPYHIYRQVIKEGLVGSKQHAAYLGTELAKAHVALQLGKDYVQDQDLF